MHGPRWAPTSTFSFLQACTILLATRRQRHQIRKTILSWLRLRPAGRIPPITNLGRTAINENRSGRFKHEVIFTNPPWLKSPQMPFCAFFFSNLFLLKFCSAKEWPRYSSRSRCCSGRIVCGKCHAVNSTVARVPHLVHVCHNKPESFSAWFFTKEPGWRIFLGSILCVFARCLD